MRQIPQTIFTFAVAGLLGLSTVARASWIGAGSGTTNDASHDYNNTANWSGGTVNDTFPSSFSFITSAPTLYFKTDRTTVNNAGGVTGRGLDIEYTGAFALTIQGGSTDGASAANHTLTLNGDVVINPASNVGVTLGSLTANNNLNLDLGGALRTINVNTSKSLTVLNAVSDGGINKTGLGAMTLQGADTYAGITAIHGGVFSVNGTSGALSNTSAIYLDHSAANTDTLVVGDASNYVADRISNSAGITLNGALFQYIGKAGTVSNETVGQVTLNTAFSTIQVNNGTSSTATLTLASLQRDSSATGGRGNSTIIGGTGVLGTSSFIKLADNGASLTQVGGTNSRTTDKTIVPYLSTHTGGNPAAAANTLVHYDPTNGFVPLNTATDYVRITNTSANNNSFPTVNADGNDNVRLSILDNGATSATPTISNVTLSSSKTINALMIDDDNGANNTILALLGSGTPTLTVNSGVVATVATNSFNAVGFRGAGGANIGSTTPASNFTLAFGTREANFTADESGGQNINIFANLTGSNGATFTATPNAFLTQSLGGNNTGLTGPITVNSGTLQINTNSATVKSLPTGDMRVRDGATLLIVPGLLSGNAPYVANLYGSGLVTTNDQLGHAFNIGGPTGNTVTGTTVQFAQVGGVISPGDNPDGSNPHATGTLSFKDGNAFNSGETAFNVNLKSGGLNIDLDSSTAFDRLALSATFSTTPTVLTINNGGAAGTGTMDLNLTLGYAPTVGSLFEIIDVDKTHAMSGAFSNTDASNQIVIHSGLDNLFYFFTVLYNESITGGAVFSSNPSDAISGNDVLLRLDTISNVPEPASLGILVLGAGLVLSRRRRA